MKKRFIDLQMFAAANADLKSTETATYGKRMNETEAHTYYDMTLKDAMYESFDLEKYCDTIALPKNHGKKMRLRKSGKYVANFNTLTEGVVPQEDEPMNTYEYEVSLGSYGGYIKFTDELDLFSIDSGETTRLQRNQGYAVGEKMQSMVRNLIWSSKNHYFAGLDAKKDTAKLTDLATARTNVGKFNLSDFIKIKTFLRRNKVTPWADGCFLVLISPEVEGQLMDLTKSGATGQYTFIELANYAQNTKVVYDGEIGKWNGFRFVTSDAIVDIASGVHGCIILGKYQNEAGTKIVKLEGNGAPKTVLKSLESGGANENPLNQIGSIGWKMHGYGGTVLYDEAVMIYECSADSASDYNYEDANAKRDTLVAKNDKDGSRVTGSISNSNSTMSGTITQTINGTDKTVA